MLIGLVLGTLLFLVAAVAGERHALYIPAAVLGASALANMVFA